MSDCPYDYVDCPSTTTQCYTYGNATTIYYRYDPCNCGRPYAGCFAGIYWPDVIPWLVAGLIIGFLPYLYFRIHLWRVQHTNLSKADK